MDAVRNSFRLAIIAGLSLWLTAEASAQQNWTNAQLLNDPGWATSDVKSAHLEASIDGGFHACYTVNGLRYRRYDGTSLLPEKTIFTGLTFNPDIDEAANGDVHLVWENWANQSPYVGWSRSTDGGATFSSAINISTSGDSKHPQIAGFGLGSSDDALMGYWDANTEYMRYNFFNGSSWLGDTSMGVKGNSQYEVTGMDRSPIDGSVYRTYDNGPWIVARRFNGSSWDGELAIDNYGFSPRIECAVNDAGQIMVVWDADNVHRSVLYTPGAGPSAQMILTYDGSWGTSVCNIPGSNNFYTAYPKNLSGNARLYGRMYAGGGWLPEEQVTYGLSDDFTVGPQVSADPNGTGTIYAVWEWWGNGNDKPQQYFATRAGLPPGPTGTVTGTVRDQYNQPVMGALVSVSGVNSTVTLSDGTYSMQLPAGTHDVVTSKSYFTTDTETGVGIVDGQTTSGIDFQITASAPAPITNLTTTGYDGRIRLTWANSPSGNHEGTVIRYSTTGPITGINDGTLIADLNSEEYQFTHEGLVNGQTYYYGAFAYFDDASRYYASAATATGSPTAAPKVNLLTNGGMDTFTNNIANGWSTYRVNDPYFATLYDTDYSYYVTNPSQMIRGIDSTILFNPGYSAAGLYQVVNGVTPGKIYQLVGYVDVWTSDYSPDFDRYVIDFGINTSGGTDPGTPTYNGQIGGAKWMTPDQRVVNTDSGSTTRYGGFHKAWASYEAESSSVSVWTGVTVDNQAPRDPQQNNYYTDYFFLFEWDFPANAGLQNGNFEGAVIDLQNATPSYSGNDSLPASWIPAGGAFGQWADILTSADGARSGAKGLRVANRRGTINGGVMQKIACTEGNYQTFSAWVKSSGMENTHASVGIDPYGHGDITSSDIVWTSDNSGVWTQIEVSAVAQAPQVTLFLRTHNVRLDGTGTYHYSDFDDCAWSETVPPDPGTIEGFVLDTCGDPVAGAALITTPGNYTGTSLTDGSYTISGAITGAYTVAASKSGYADSSTAGVEVLPLQTTQADIEMLPAQSGTITGTILNECGGPVAGVTVTTSVGCLSDTTDANGQYTIEHVPAGTMNVVFTEPTYQTYTETGVVVGDQQTTTVDVTFIPQSVGSISGVVQSCGTPVAGATVWTVPGCYQATTLGDGSYSLPNVRSGLYTVHAEADGYIAGQADNVQVSEGQTTTTPLSLGSYSLEERIFNGNYEGGSFSFWGGLMPNGWGAGWRDSFQGSARWDVPYFDANHGHVVRLYNIDAGFEIGVKHELTNLPAGATYIFSAWAYQGSTETLAYLGVDTATGVNLPPRDHGFPNVAGQWNYAEVTGTVPADGRIVVSLWAYHQSGSSVNTYFDNASLVVQLPGNDPGSIEGFVYDASGAPIEGAVVGLTTGGQTDVTDTTGAYALTDITPGDYSINIAADGFVPRTSGGITVGSCQAAYNNIYMEESSGTWQQLLLNGDFEGGFESFWGGYMPSPMCPADPQCWGATYRGTFSNNGTWGQQSFTGHGYTTSLNVITPNYELGITQGVGGLTPGARFVFSAEAYCPDAGTNAWLAADPDGGTALPARQTHFDNTPNTWAYQEVSGTVGAGGKIRIFLWAWRQWGNGAYVYFDNARLMVETPYPVTLPDYDEDNDVDMADFAELQRCITGQGQTRPSACREMDRDKDMDVDLYDAALFGLCAGGPGLPGDSGCLTAILQGMVPDWAHDPSPADDAQDVRLSTTLSWQAGHGAVSHDIYFGTTNPPAYITNQTGATYNTGLLAPNTTYYWQIAERNATGVNPGPVWKFTTYTSAVENLNRYSFFTTGVGAEYYGDRVYTITSLPAQLSNRTAIKTNNDDKSNSAADWINFDLNVPADIYIIYDNRATQFPAWMIGFASTGQTVGVSDGGANPMNVYKRAFAPGHIQLGGNKQSPAAGSDAMYWVVIVPTGQ